MKIGIDLGNGYVKFKGKKFASKVKMGRLANFGDKREDAFQVNYKGLEYVVGDGGIFTTDDRYYTNDYKLCLLTAIALSSNKTMIDVEVCVGLPVMKYMGDEKFKVEEHLNNSLGIEKIKINGEEKIINIKKITVFIEGALIIKTKNQGNVLTIDIGAGTVNLIRWENQKPMKYDTIPISFYGLYEKIAKYFKDTGKGDVAIEHIEKNLSNDYIMIKQEKVDLKCTNGIIENHVREMISSMINKGFDPNTVDEILLLGGGALATYSYFKKLFPSIKLADNCQFINSEIYETVLESGV